MKTIILNALQVGLNHYLSLDPESSKRIENLSEKIIKIVLPHQTIALQFSAGKILFLSDIPSESDLILTGTPLSFLRFALTKDQQIFKNDIAAEGDLELAQQIMDIFDQLEVDWEELASRWIGDIPASRLGKLSRKFNQWNSNFQEVVTKNITDYLQEEVLLVPAPEALQDFFSDVDMLRMDVDRLEARLKLLQERCK